MSRVHLRGQGSNGPKDWIGTVSADGKLFIRFGTVGGSQQTKQIAPNNFSEKDAVSELYHRAGAKRREGYEEVTDSSAEPTVDPDTGQAVTPADAEGPVVFSVKARRNSAEESALDIARNALPEQFKKAREVKDNTHVTVAHKLEDTDPDYNRWVMVLEMLGREGATVFVGRRNSNASLDVTQIYEQLKLSPDEAELTFALGLKMRPVDMSDAQPDWMQDAVMV